jgi:sugar transferase EpsL
VNHLYSRCGKRALDIVAATLALICVAPVLAVVAIAIHTTMGRPILFRQRRPGLHGRQFAILKFRTMRTDRDEAGDLIPDAQRLTRLGRLLRTTSADELPELWNVVRGEMTLVGPRPLLTQYVSRYTPEQARRHEVRPGITGWAQVNGRNAISWEEKFALDVWYVDNCSFAIDMKILALTAWQVLARRGINQPGHATAEEFMGTHAEMLHER